MKQYDETILRFTKMLLDRIGQEATGDPPPLFRDEDLPLSRELVELAGFEVVEVERGALDRIVSPRNPNVMGTRITGVDNPITRTRFTCANAPDDFATRWFEQLVKRVAYEVTCNGRDESGDGTRLLTEIWKFLDDEIARAQPLRPIQLTSVGDAMGEIWPTPHEGNFFVAHPRDEDSVPEGWLGVHMICGGGIEHAPTTPTHNALWCATCHLRATFPRTTKTYGDLRHHFKSVLNT